jgi:PIN domain nuclease of toxin-antitoxin system
MIEHPAHTPAFSVASIWEIVIKCSLGRKDFNIEPRVLRAKLIENGYAEMEVRSEHALFLDSLPDLHRDPFDRLPIAQSAVEGCTLLTSDPLVASYPGRIVGV